MHHLLAAACLAAALAIPVASCSSHPASLATDAGDPVSVPRETLARGPSKPAPVLGSRIEDTSDVVNLVGRGIAGIALVDDEGHAIATADTGYPVVDIAADPDAGRWIVAEYADDSANQLSVWQMTRDRGGVGLTLAGARSTEGQCHVFGSPAGPVIIQYDGLQSRWALASADLQMLAWQALAPVPSSLFASEDASTMRLGVVQEDEPAGPRTTLVQWEVSAQSLGVVRERSVGTAWNTLDPVKACAIGDDRIALARAADDHLRVDVVSLGTLAVVSSAQLVIGPAARVLDMVCNGARREAFVLVTAGEDALVARMHADTLRLMPVLLPGSIDRGRWPSRHLAWNALGRRLLVAGDGSVAALDVAGETARVAWKSDAIRAPVTTSRCERLSVRARLRREASDEPW